MQQRAAYGMRVTGKGSEGMRFFRPTEVSNQGLRDIAACSCALRYGVD